MGIATAHVDQKRSALTRARRAADNPLLMTESALERGFEPQPESTQPGRRDTVLLLAQSPEWVAIARLARDHGHLVLEARNVFEALTHMRDAAPDLVLLPGDASGFELLDRLRGEEGGSGVSAIVLTRSDDLRALIGGVRPRRRRRRVVRRGSRRARRAHPGPARAARRPASGDAARPGHRRVHRGEPRAHAQARDRARGARRASGVVRLPRVPRAAGRRERARPARTRRDPCGDRRHRGGRRAQARRDRLLARAPRAPAPGHAGERRRDEAEPPRPQAVRPHLLRRRRRGEDDAGRRLRRRDARPRRRSRPVAGTGRDHARCRPARPPRHALDPAPRARHEPGSRQSLRPLARPAPDVRPGCRPAARLPRCAAVPVLAPRGGRLGHRRAGLHARS